MSVAAGLSVAADSAFAEAAESSAMRGRELARGAPSRAGARQKDLIVAHDRKWPSA